MVYYTYMYSEMNLPIHAEEILENIKGYVEMSDNYLERRFRRLREQYRLLRKSKTDPVIADSIKGSLCITTLDVLRSIDQSNFQNITFKSVDDNPISIDRAKYITAAANNDARVGNYDLEHMKAKDQARMTGLGVVAITGWDPHNHMPIMQAIPTYSIIADPDGGSDPNRHRWFGFRMKYRTADMKSAGSNFNAKAVEWLEKLSLTDTKDEKSLEEQIYYSNTDGYQTEESNTGSTIENYEDYKKKQIKINKALGIIHAYDIYTSMYDKKQKKAYKYLITVDQSASAVLRCVRIEPVTKAEKKNPLLVKFPIAFYHYMQLRQGDLLGESVIDVTEDKQVAQATLLNLANELVKRNLQPPLLYRDDSINPEKVSYDLEKMIPISRKAGEPERPINADFGFLPTHPVRTSDVLSLTEKIEQQSERVTGSSDATAGVGVAQGVTTLGQARILEQNASARFKKRLTEGLKVYKEVWTLWLSEVQRNYSPAKENKKSVLINNGVTEVSYDLSKEDFVSENPRIFVTSSLIEHEKGAQKNQTLVPMLNNLIGKENEVTEKEILREVLMNGGYSEQEALKLVPKSLIEQQVEEENMLLSEDIEVKVNDGVPLKVRIAMQSDIPTNAGRKFAQEIKQRAIEINEQQANQQALQAQPLPQGAGDVNQGQFSPTERTAGAELTDVPA